MSADGWEEQELLTLHVAFLLEEKDAGICRVFGSPFEVRGGEGGVRMGALFFLFENRGG